MKVCYITKDPFYQELIYIETYRHAGGPFTVGNNTSGLLVQSFTFPLSQPLPAGSVPNIVERSFLNAWNIDGTISGRQNNIDVYPSTSFPDENNVMLKLETIRDKIVVNFYSMTVVYFWSVLPSASPSMSEIKPNALTRYFINFREAVAPGASLLSISTTMKMYEYNTLAGLKGFHARAYQTVNFLNFKIEFPNDTTVQFPTLNSQNIEFMKFEILVFYQKICPPTEPYFLLYLADCVSVCPVGYVTDTDQNCVANLELKLQYILKQPDANKIDIQFSLQSNDPSFNSLYSQLNWTNIISLDIQTLSKTVQYISGSDPKLKLKLQYAEDLESSDKTLTISEYDTSNFPVNFKGFETKTITIPKITSQNNLAIKNYPESAYSFGKVTSYFAMALSALYMVSFLTGFVMGKVYILQMAFVPQVVFISLIAMNNISPVMAGLGFLKYVFGYSYAQFPSTLSFNLTYGQGQNYMTLIGVSQYFIYNFNLMFGLSLVAFALFVVFYVKGKNQQQNKANHQDRTQHQSLENEDRKAYEFFVFDSLLYLVLWFGVWIIFAGEIQINSLLKGTTENSLLNYLGLAFFGLNTMLFFVYFVVYLKKLNKINSFQQCLKDRNNYQGDESQQNRSHQQRQQQQNKIKYFYIIYFVEKLIIASIFSFFSSIKFINCIIAGLHLAIIILLIIFRPYKIKHSQSLPSNSQQQSTIKPIIRPILNYTFSLIIQVLFFVTNQIQSLALGVYVPLIILCLLLVHFGLTVMFLVKDHMVKKDLDYLKRLFCGTENQDDKENHYSQVANGTPRKLDAHQIKIELLKKNPDLMKTHRQKDANHFSFNQKVIDQRQQSSDKNGENKPYQVTNNQPNYQNYFQQLNHPQKNPRQNLSIDQMLELMAEKNHNLQLQQSQVEAAKLMLDSAQKTLDKVKKQKKFFESQSKVSKTKQVIKNSDPFALHSEWKELEDVDSSRMDKLIEFDKKRKEEATKGMV